MLNWYWWVSVAVAVISVSPVKAVQIKAIDSQKVKELKAEYAKAQSLSKAVLGEVSQWDCRMYGMRSRWKVHDKKNLYAFKLQSGSQADEAAVQNNGDHVITEYTLKDNVLRGSLGSLHESIRLTATGQLISEMSLPESAEPKTDSEIPALSAPNRKVLAYVLCSG